MFSPLVSTKAKNELLTCIMSSNFWFQLPKSNIFRQFHGTLWRSYEKFSVAAERRLCTVSAILSIFKRQSSFSYKNVPTNWFVSLNEWMNEYTCTCVLVLFKWHCATNVHRVTVSGGTNRWLRNTRFWLGRKFRKSEVYILLLIKLISTVLKQALHF